MTNSPPKNGVFCSQAFVVSVGVFLCSFPASAHLPQEFEPGMSHVLLSLDHILAFLVIGMVATAVIYFRRPQSIFFGNAILLSYLGFEAIWHGLKTEVLFGLEVALSGALIAFASSQLIFLFRKHANKQRRGNQTNMSPSTK
ncbi:MAG: hypothetical protein CMM52_00460 [Rhodospirillaceae bacterium]|nr:hypothetical protein [Rhodospirillaceae bacterium]